MFHMGQIRQKERGETFQGKIKQDDSRKHQQRSENGKNRLDFHDGRQEIVNGPVQHERQKAGGSQQRYFRGQAGQMLFHPDACIHDHHDSQKHANGRLFPQGNHSGGIQRNAQQIKSTGSNGNRLHVVRRHVEETEKEEHRRKQQDFDADQKRRQQRENDNVPQEPGRADRRNGMGIIRGEKVDARKEDVPNADQILKAEGSSVMRQNKEHVQHIPEHEWNEQP